MPRVKGAKSQDKEESTESGISEHVTMSDRCTRRGSCIRNTKETKEQVPDTEVTWSDDDEGKLFWLLKDAVFLYDTHHSMKKDNAAKEKKVQEIAKELKQEGEYVFMHML